MHFVHKMAQAYPSQIPAAAFATDVLLEFALHVLRLYTFFCVLRSRVCW